MVAAALIAPGLAEATTDSYTGIGKHSWVVPPGVTQLTVDVVGGGGGTDSGGNGCTPGTGADLQGTIQVPPGAQLTIDVGGRGGDAPLDGSGGAAGGGGDLDGGGGGAAGTSGPGGGPVGGGGGGGGTMISSTSGAIVVAGGGGGCGGFASPFPFGNGGDHGLNGVDGSQSAGGGGAETGATPTSGGASDPTTEPAGSAGSGGQGGTGAGNLAGLHFGGGGGGGGYVGGGGGGGAEYSHGIAGGGAGGSDLVPAGITVAAPGSTGNGHVTITYTSSWAGQMVGQVFVPLVSRLPSRDGWTLLQTGGPIIGGDPNPWVIHSTGVITAWGFETASQVPGTLKLKVGRGERVPLSGGNFTIVGSSTSGTLLPNQLNTYDVRIPVQAGDMLGAYQAGTTNTGSVQNDFFPDYATGADHDVASGATQFFDFDDFGVKVPIVARVEPDADGDGFGDQSQDQCLGRFGTASGCPHADLALTATPNATSVNVGQSVIYTLTATNNGPDPVPVTITDPLPTGAKVLSAVSNPGSCVAGPPVTCDFGTIASGQTGTATVVLEATQAGTLTNTATVAAPAVPAGIGAGDLNSANDTASASTTVLAGGGTPGGGTPGGTPGGDVPGGGTPGGDITGGGAPGAALFKGVKIILKHGRITVKKGVARVSVRSTHAAKGRFKLTVVTGKGKKRKTVVLGSATFTIGAGKTRTVALRLTRPALNLLKTRRGSLKVLAIAIASDKTGVPKTTQAHATLKL